MPLSNELKLMHAFAKLLDETDQTLTPAEGTRVRAWLREKLAEEIGSPIGSPKDGS